MSGRNSEAMSTEDFLRKLFKNGEHGSGMDFRRAMGMRAPEQAAQGRGSGWNEADHPRDDIGQFTFKENGGTETRKDFDTLTGTAKEPRETPEQTAERLMYPEKRLEKLYGPYRGKEGGYYRNDPVIFQAETESPHPWLYGIMGGLTENKGILGVGASQSQRAGQVQIIIHGNPTTGEPSSWGVYEWRGTGKTHVNNPAIEEHRWQLVPDAKAASRMPEVRELFSQFEKQRRMKSIKK